MDLGCATFMDDISRIQIFAAPPSVAEVVMNRAHSLRHHDERGESERNDQGADRHEKRAARCGLL